MAFTCAGSMFALNVSFTNFTVSLTYVLEFFNRSATCWPTSVPTTPRNVNDSTMIARMMEIVARPRFQPRASSLLTPGSIANAMNSDTRRRMKNELNLWNT